MANPPDPLPDTVRRFESPETRMLVIARALACDLLEVDAIKLELDVSDDEWERTVHHPAFARMVNEEREAWTRNTSVSERIRMKGLLGYEQAIPEMAVLIADKTAPAAARVAAFSALQRGAGIGAKEEGAVIDPGGKINITINLGKEAPPIHVEAVTPKVIEHIPLEVTEDA